MKLSEALSERAELNRKLKELNARIVRNAKHQEGEKPAEDPLELLEQFSAAAREFRDLVVRINLTNMATVLSDGTPMVAALAERDRLKSEHALLKSLATEATPKQDRYSKKEIRFVSSVSVSDTQAAADAAAKACRTLDGLIQQANWTNDLK